MSKPLYVPSGWSSDWGGYFGSVETTSLPALRIFSSRPPAIGAALAALLGGELSLEVAGWLAAVPDDAGGVVAPPPVQAATTMAIEARIDRRPRMDMYSSFGLACYPPGLGPIPPRAAVIMLVVDKRDGRSERRRPG